MMIILALDALDIDQVLRYKCRYLKQAQHSQTDVSDFKMLRTVALWASFLSGKNKEEDVPVDKEAQWKYTLGVEETFLPAFETYKTIDVPAFSFKQENHLKERIFMRRHFSDEGSIDDFDSVVWKNHKENKKDFFKSLSRYDLVMGYFDLADAIGHLSFGVHAKMKEVYVELEAMVRELKSSFEDFILIASDHGMMPAGRYGVHSTKGFYSVNNRLRSRIYRITDFYNLVKKVAQNYSTRMNI